MTDTPKILVNAFQSNKTQTASDPKTIAMSDGTFLVVYVTQLGGLPGDGDGFHIRGQRFDIEGQPIGPEISFPFNRIVDKRDFDLISLGGNRVAIAVDVEHDSADGLSPDLAYRVFDINEDGPVQIDFGAAISRDGSNIQPVLAGNVGPQGDDLFFFFISDGGREFVIADGRRDVGETDSRLIQPTTNTSFIGSENAEIKATTLKSGNVVYLLDRDGSDQGGSSFFFRILDSEFNTLADGEVLLPGSRVFEPQIASLNGGGFVVSFTADDGDIDVAFQVFDENGMAKTPVQTLGIEDVPGASNNNQTTITALPDGGFIIFYDKDAGAPQIRGQRFDSAGNSVGDDFLVANENGSQLDASILQDGRVAVSFLSADGMIKTVILDGQPEDIFGDDGDNVLLGTDGDDDIFGLSGNDELIGGDGDDEIAGDAGDDILLAGSGEDFVLAGSGNDQVDGGDGDDIILGEDGSDRLNAGDGNDEIRGGDGDDEIFADEGDDLIDGGAGADIIDGGSGVDTITYAASSSGVSVDLFGGLGRRGDAAGDFVLNIENVVGSSFEDIFAGDNNANIIRSGDARDTIFGRAGNDTIEGGAGGDFLEGGDGFDYASYVSSNEGVSVNLFNGDASFGDAEGDIIQAFEGLLGSAFNDVLVGNGGDNHLIGGDGDDELAGLRGNDVIEGGAGADVMDGDAGGGEGSDTLSYERSDGAVTVNLGIRLAFGGHADGDVFANFENLLGSNFNDRLVGDGGANIIEGAGGADEMFGGNGVDTLNYTKSDTGVTVSLGDRLAFGGHAEGDTFSGFENIIGSAFSDQLTGDEGNNSLQGGEGADTLDGANGFDTLSYDGSNTGVTVDLQLGVGIGGHAEGDLFSNVEGVSGSSFDDVFIGSIEDNRFFGANGDDQIFAGGGNDVVRGDSGADIIDGGDGFDQVSYEDSDGSVFIDLENEFGSSGGHAEGDRIISIESVVGSRFNDIINGNADDNALYGGADGDVIAGRLGDDYIEGGSGSDRLNGGEGNDTVSYANSDAGVTIDLELALQNSEGHARRDRIAEFENVHGSQFVDHLNGDSGANEIHGGAGNDLIAGRAGNDIIRGGAGADVMNGGAGEDTISYEASDAGVRVNLANEFGSTGGHAQGDRINDFENIYGSSFADALAGDNLSNEINGASGDDFINGSDGDDLIEGGEGADALFGGNGLDTLSYASSTSGVMIDLGLQKAEGGHAEGDAFIGFENLLGSQHNDDLIGDMAQNTIAGASGDDRLVGGTGDDVLLGDEGDDELFGQRDNDLLDGGNGNDYLRGGSGNDTLVGGAGADTFSFRDGNDTNIIRDFDASNEGDLIELERLTAITDFDDLLADHVEQDGNSVVIDDGDRTRIIIENLTVEQLLSDQFLF